MFEISPRLLVVIMIACFISLEIQADESQPNIIWISCEDISPHLGCYGDPHAITPNLDALASEGVRYAHAYTSAGVCAPVDQGSSPGCTKIVLAPIT